MKLHYSKRRNCALTLIEVMAVIIGLILVVSITGFCLFSNFRKRGQWINCTNNLEKVGLAYQIWQRDHNDKFPMETSVTNGGAMELIVNGKNAWLNYLVMSNELITPKILHCPADLNTFAAANFSNFSNQNISYFVSLNASEKFPQTMLAGDDNFEITDLFEIIGDPVKSGLLEISGRTSVAWTAARHRFVGNILMTDGSVKTINISTLNNLSHIVGVTNRLAIP